MLFASQVAAAITNARAHRDEQRTRADMEALTETTLIGVVFFDARTGQPVSFILTVNAGRVSTYESLIRQLWNGPDSGDADRVHTFIKQLWRKLGDDPAKPAYILNERGVGHRVPGLEE